MKKGILLAMIIWSVVLVAQEQTLVLASDIWPPFTDKEGKISVASDIVVEALTRAGLKSQIVIEDFGDVLSGIKSNQFQGSAALWKTEQREQFLVFSKPYLQNQLILVGLKGTNPNAIARDDLHGKNIGLVKGYAYQSDVLTDPGISMVYGQSDQENLEKLFDGSIDYMLVDDLLIQYLLENQTNDVNEWLEIGHVPFEVAPLYFALNKNTPNAESIIAGFNAQINTMITDGSYHEILNLKWVRVDVDGDGEAELVLNGEQAGKEEPADSYAVFHEPNSSHENTNYMVGGKKYSSWEDVPNQYKVDVSRQVADPTMSLKINLTK